MNDFETKLLEMVKVSIDKSISDAITGYNSPVINIVKNTLASKEDVIQDMITDSIDCVLNLDEFKLEVHSAVRKYLATILVSKISGGLEKQVSLIRNNPITNSKFMVGMDKLIEEILEK